MKSLDERFWTKVEKGSFKDCWLWTGAKNNLGYGNLNVGGKYRNAHRVSYVLHYGLIPDGYFVCHKCDTPSCVNPYHLFLGLPIDNDRDKVSKMRHTFGEKHPMHKLTEETVRKVFKEDGAAQKIADKFGISRRSVRNIKTGKSWSHLNLQMPTTMIVGEGQALPLLNLQ